MLREQPAGFEPFFVNKISDEKVRRSENLKCGICKTKFTDVQALNFHISNKVACFPDILCFIHYILIG